jgi:hypothetical protein
MFDSQRTFLLLNMVTGKFCLLVLGDNNHQGHSRENLGPHDLEDFAAPPLAQAKDGCRRTDDPQK